MNIHNFTRPFQEKHLRVIEDGLSKDHVIWLLGQVFPLDFPASEKTSEMCLFLSSLQLDSVQKFIQSNQRTIQANESNFTYRGRLSWIASRKDAGLYELIQNAEGFYGHLNAQGEIDSLRRSEGRLIYLAGKKTQTSLWRAPHFCVEQPKGLSVSQYQGDIDWNAVSQSGVAFAFVKVSYGSSHKDPMFESHWGAMEKLGILRGPCHVFNSGQSGASQAENFLAVIEKNGMGELPPALNIEECKTDPASFMKEVHLWLKIVGSKMKRKPIISTSPMVWEGVGGSGIGDYHFWISSYGGSEPILPQGVERWLYWQYSAKNKVDGIDVEVEQLRFNGFSGDLKRDYVPRSTPKKDKNIELPLPEEVQSLDNLYVVREGDTLASIGQNFGTTPRDLLEVNELSQEVMIFVGQRLIIPIPSTLFTVADL